MGKAAASPRVQDEWLRRVEAEYRSTALATNLALWLVQVGASPDLVRDALRISREELRHAVMSHRVHVAACGSGDAAPLSLDRATLQLTRHPSEPLERDIARVCVEVFCLGETVAVRLFKELRQQCRQTVARKTLDRVLRDEVGHREFGWRLLEWLLGLPGQAASLRALIEAELPDWLAALQAQYAPLELRGSATMAPSDARWGLMPPARYAQLLHTTLHKDFLPRFARLGIVPRLAESGLTE